MVLKNFFNPEKWISIEFAQKYPLNFRYKNKKFLNNYGNDSNNAISELVGWVPRDAKLLNNFNWNSLF